MGMTSAGKYYAVALIGALICFICLSLRTNAQQTDRIPFQAQDQSTFSSLLRTYQGRKVQIVGTLGTYVVTKVNVDYLTLEGGSGAVAGVRMVPFHAIIAVEPDRLYLAGK